MTGGGKSALGFLNLKSFHPSNKSNQRKLFIAEQKQEDAVKREKERKSEFEKEQELHKNRQFITSKQEKEKAKAQQEMHFMYAPPPGFKKEGDDDDPNKPKSHKEQEIEKFPFLKDAPVQGNYTDNLQVHHKPFGIELRNVKCARCHQWGHQSGDRECPMKDAPSSNDDHRRKLEDPLVLYSDIHQNDGKLQDGLVLRRRCLSPVNRGSDDNQQLLPETEQSGEKAESDDDVEKEFLASLTHRQRKLLLKEFKREERKKKKAKKEKSEKKDKRKREKGEKEEKETNGREHKRRKEERD